MLIFMKIQLGSHILVDLMAFLLFVLVDRTFNFLSAGLNNQNCQGVNLKM